MAAPFPKIAEEKLDVFRQITHVIFDVDGLLLDTETLYTRGTNNMLAPYKKTFTMDMKRRVMGRPRTEVAKILISELDLPITVEEYVVKIQDEMNKTMETAELLPGAERLVRHLASHDVPMALVSGSTAENHRLKTSKHRDMFSVFLHETMAGSDPQVKRGKPFPDGYLLAKDKFKSPPEAKQILVFEDAPNGVESAWSAGMPVVWVPDRTVVTDPLSSPALDQSLLMLDSLQQFNPEWIGLPPYAD